VTLVLSDELDISRGDLLLSPDAPATVASGCKAALVWMDQRPLESDRRYLLKHSSQTVPAFITALDYRINIGTLAHEPAETLEMNGIGLASLRLPRPIALDRYAENRHTGAFILIDPETNATVAAGIVVEIIGCDASSQHTFTAGPVTVEERAFRWGHRGGILKLNGPARFIDLIERSLFVTGAVTVRSSHLEPAELLANAGVLALVTTPVESEFLSARVGREEITLSADDPDAAIAAVHKLLAQARILSSKAVS